MVTVACVLNSRTSAGAGGTCYTPEWVWRLKRQVNRWLPDATFRYLSDVAPGPWRIPLEHDWPGWWAKLELFRPHIFAGPVLYLDLDTLIVGDLSRIASYRGPFAMLSDFYKPASLASGVMAWTPGPHTEAIYHRFREGVRTFEGRSDRWYARNAPTADRLQDLYPGEIVSLKAHARKGVPDGARLVCGHGNPRLSDPRAGWAHRAWRTA